MSGTLALHSMLGEAAAPMSESAPDPTTAPAEAARLVRRILAGEPGADRALWDAYAPLVRRFMRRAVGPDFDAQDLVQEVFLEVWKRLGQIQKPDALRSFVFAVATNVVRMELRRRRVRARYASPTRGSCRRSSSATPSRTSSPRAGACTATWIACASPSASASCCATSRGSS
jgi:RNA polymerase sigma-70 factor (ECF subfamily)